MNPPPLQPPGHRMILASAGSGKTYALTNRFVQLLALGAAPERIVALTFTRKAAGEFSDEILKKLARAAADPDYASTLARELFPDDAQRRLFKAQHSAFSVQRSTSASAPPSPPPPLPPPPLPLRIFSPCCVSWWKTYTASRSARSTVFSVKL